jgi:hypothetical protein
MNTVLVTSREFRSRQREFMDIVDQGHSNVCIRRGQRFYAIVPVEMGKDVSVAIDSERKKYRHD